MNATTQKRLQYAGAVSLLVALFAAPFVAFHVLFNPWFMYRIEIWLIGVENIQSACIEAINKPGENGIADIPTNIRRLGKIVHIQQDENGDRYVMFGNGGGHGHWGLVVGRPSFMSEYGDGEGKLADGVWLWHD